MHDTTLQIGHVDVVPAEDHVVIVLHQVLLMPVGNGQAMPVPAGVYKVPMAKDVATGIAEKILEEVANVEGDVPQQAKNDLVIAQNLNGIDRAVEQEKKLRGQ